MPLIDTILEILERYSPNSVHYKDIATEAKKLGWVPKAASSKPEEYEIYAEIYFYAKKGGDRIASAKRGYYYLGHGQVVRKQQREPSKPPEKPFSGVKTCGNCANLQYDDVQIIRLEVGNCGLAEKSGRVLGFHRQEACPLWKLKSTIKMEQDYKRHDVIRETILKVNPSLQSTRRKST